MSLGTDARELDFDAELKAATDDPKSVEVVPETAGDQPVSDAHPEHPEQSARYRSDGRRDGGRMRPGRIVGQHQLHVETREGVAIVLGRQRSEKKEAILGLYMFGGRVYDLWKASADDDPYADSFLLRIHALMDTEKAEVDAAVAKLEAAVKSVPGVTFGDAHSLDPVSLDLSFKTPYGYRGAYLVAAYDNMVRLVLNAKFLGLLTPQQASKVIYGRGRRIRHLFQLPTQWKYTGVNRTDMKLGTQTAATAIKVMGELEQAILDGTKRAPHAPRIRQQRRVPLSDVVDDESGGTAEPARGDEAASDSSVGGVEETAAA